MDTSTIILISVLTIVIALDRILKKSTDNYLKVYSTKRYKLFNWFKIIIWVALLTSIIIPSILIRNQFIDNGNYTFFQDFLKNEVGYVWISLYVILLVTFITFSFFTFSFFVRERIVQYFEIVKNNLRPFTAVIFGILVIKILLHYFLFPTKAIWDLSWRRLPTQFLPSIKYGISEGEFYPFRYYVREVFSSEILLFVPAIAILLLITWFFLPTKKGNKV